MEIISSVDADIQEALVQNKNCKILQCHLNDYTDFVKISFANDPENNSVVYRVHIIQTKPNVTNTISGNCDSKDFGKFVHDMVTQFAKSVNQDKVCDDWETSFVITDNLKKRNEIKNWTGKTISNFVETIDDITHEVVERVA